MLKIYSGVFAVSMLVNASAFAACTMDDVMKKADEVTTVLMEKAQAKPDEITKLTSEVGTVLATGTVTDATCVKLDDLTARAKKL